MQLTLQDTDCKFCPSPPLCLISPSWPAVSSYCSTLKEDSRPFSSMIQEPSYSKGILKGSESHPPIYMTPKSYLCKINDIPVFSSKFLVLTLFSSVHFSHSVMSNSLWPHALQHARLPCPSPTPRACWNSCASSRWCHPTISSSVDPFSSCLQSFPAWGSFQMNQLFASDG